MIFIIFSVVDYKRIHQGMNRRVSKKEKTRIRRIKKRKKLQKDNRKYRNELKQKREELKEQEKINERISNIYKTDTQKAAIRRFITIYYQLDQFDNNTQKYLKNLNKINSTKSQNTTKTHKFHEQTTKWKDTLK